MEVHLKHRSLWPDENKDDNEENDVFVCICVHVCVCCWCVSGLLSETRLVLRKGS